MSSLETRTLTCLSLLGRLVVVMGSWCLMDHYTCKGFIDAESFTIVPLRTIGFL